MRLVTSIGGFARVCSRGVDKRNNWHRTLSKSANLFGGFIVVLWTPNAIVVFAVLADKANTTNLTIEVHIGFTGI